MYKCSGFLFNAMKRFLWGLIKIAVVVGLLVWGAYKFFPETFNGEDAPQTDQPQKTELEFTEELTKEDILGEAEEVVEVTKTPVASIDWVSQKQRYASYAVVAGTPAPFNASITMNGTELVSEQLARAFHESVTDWSNLSEHQKTFWVLYELVKQNINVDAMSLFEGRTIVIQKGVVTLEMTGTTKRRTSSSRLQSSETSMKIVSRTAPTPERTAVPLARHLRVNPATVVSPATESTSAIYWNAVLEMNNVDSRVKKLPVYQERVSSY